MSFVVRRPGGRYLHHNFVVALLNDLFGIQSRGGCSCAGPYGHRLLGIDIERSHEFEREITPRLRGHQARLGAGQLQLLHLARRSFDYVVEAVRLVAEHGWRLLPDYRFDPATGLWRHRAGPVEPPLRLAAGRLRRRRRDELPAHDEPAPESALAGYLEQARRLLRGAVGRRADATTRRPGVADFEHLRWFELPAACVEG